MLEILAPCPRNIATFSVKLVEGLACRNWVAGRQSFELSVQFYKEAGHPPFLLLNCLFNQCPNR
jgi:hypothetical protein